MKLLLVEDDFDLAGALSRSLVARGFQVLCCADGKKALEAAWRFIAAVAAGGLAGAAVGAGGRDLRGAMGLSGAA